jgi:hypothetical protein
MNAPKHLLYSLMFVILFGCAHHKPAPQPWIENDKALGTVVAVARENGRFVKEYRDHKNLLAREEFYGKDQQLEPGACIVEFTYDNRERLVRTSYFDRQHLLTPSADGFAQAVHSYLDTGTNRIDFLDINGNPALRTDNVSSVLKTTALDSGNTVTCTTFLDTSGLPVKSTSGHAVAHRKYDHNNRLIEIRFFDEQKFPCLTAFKKIPVHRVKYTTVKGVNNRSVLVEHCYDIKNTCLDTLFYSALSWPDIEDILEQSDISSLTYSESQSTTYHYNNYRRY